MWKCVSATIMMIVVFLVAFAGPGSAHEERDVTEPDGSGSVPTYRTSGTELLVCHQDLDAFEASIASFPTPLRERNSQLWTTCQSAGYRAVQDAVDAAVPGARILILPGTYTEDRSMAEPTEACASLPARWSRLHTYQILTFDQQVACPHNQNLIAVLGKPNIQIEGTGQSPDDVIIDAQFRRLNALRVDRSDGFYIRNITLQRTTFNDLYVMESDGFVIDHVVGRWSSEYAFLTFAVDHGLYTDCEAYGNGDSGMYPGAAHDINRDRGRQVDRYAVEIRNCYSHHNTLGYAGTAGDSVWVHDSEFTNNAVGIATDSVFPHHPGMPQNHGLFERNTIGENNQDYLAHIRSGECARPVPEQGIEQGVVCPKIALPVGTGIVLAGGNDNIWRDNWVFGNHYAGIMTMWTPGLLREDDDLTAQFDTSHHNAFYGNHLGVDIRTGASAPNGIDYWWDGQGIGNCWQAPADGGQPITAPECQADGDPVGLGTARLLGEPAASLKLLVCLQNSNAIENRFATNCDWFGVSGLGRIEVQWAVGEALLLAVCLVLATLRLTPRSKSNIAALLIGLAGLVVGVAGTVVDGTRLTGAGLLLLGSAWLHLGWSLRRRGRRPLGSWTIGLAVTSLLGAVDRGWWMLPLVPIAPTWVRIVGEIVWIPWIFSTSFRRTVRPKGQDMTPARTPRDGAEDVGAAPR